MEPELQQQFEKVFTTLDEAFKKIDARFADVDRRFDGIDKRFDGVDKRFDGIDGQLTAIRTTLRRHEVLLDENSKELRLAARTFQALHDVERGRLDVAREALDRRLANVELSLETVALGPHAER